MSFLFFFLPHITGFASTLLFPPDVLPITSKGAMLPLPPLPVSLTPLRFRVARRYSLFFILLRAHVGIRFDAGAKLFSSLERVLRQH